ncbi:MAG: bifunctional oligoribonuclease/PAP phosphatase NrnA [Promethearchaeota archaeon]
MKLLDSSQFLVELLSRATKAPVALILHQSADPDAVGSAEALSVLLKMKTGVKCTLFAESLNRAAKKIVKKFNLIIAPAEELVDYSTVILVDLNNLDQIGTLAEHFPKTDCTVFCIDHHVFHHKLSQLADFVLHDDQVRSTAELVLKIWLESGVSIPSHVASLLACAVVYDSRHFGNALNSTFEHFIILLRYGADYSVVRELLRTPLEKSERIARLKAVGRIVVYDEFDLLIAVTTIGSYEASVCRALISVGADIAIACALKKDEVRLSARSNPAVFNDYGLDLAKHVMEPLGDIIGGSGGGHPTAAGANGTAASEHALGLAVQLLRKALKARLGTSASSQPALG